MMRRAAVTYREPAKAEPYAEALRAAGVDPVLIPAESLRGIDGLDGLLLSGGTDLNPKLYGSAPQATDEEPDDQRDALEARLLAEAMAAGLPVLAICRGMQLFNVAHGGTLVQHLPSARAHVVRDRDAAEPVHDIEVLPGTRLASIFGPGVQRVNSRHHQAVARVGAGLLVSARSTSDGVIEALERAGGGFAVAVQWHPEDQVRRDREQRKLFAAFARELRAE